MRILIADDHPVFREGLRALLECEGGFRVVGEAGDGGEAIALVEKLRPDVLLLDLRMPIYPGLEVLRALAKSESLRTIVLTASIERDQIVEAVLHGARGVVVKHCSAEILFKSIRTVMAGEYWIGRNNVADLVALLRANGHRSKPADLRLSERERDVLALVVKGYSNRDIAEDLSISVQTVKHHLTSLFAKVGAANRLELALVAISRLGEE